MEQADVSNATNEVLKPTTTRRYRRTRGNIGCIDENVDGVGLKEPKQEEEGMLIFLKLYTSKLDFVCGPLIVTKSNDSNPFCCG